jgi:hypothetical protein
MTYLSAWLHTLLGVCVCCTSAPHDWACAYMFMHAVASTKYCVRHVHHSMCMHTCACMPSRQPSKYCARLLAWSVGLMFHHPPSSSPVLRTAAVISPTARLPQCSGRCSWAKRSRRLSEYFHTSFVPPHTRSSNLICHLNHRHSRLFTLSVYPVLDTHLTLAT